MRDIIAFCTENDPHKEIHEAEFKANFIEDELIRKECGHPTNKPLNDHEKKIIQAKLDHYYEKNWSSVIIAVMEFKNPCVANAHTLTSISAKVDQSHKLFFHIDWVKPGRHTFVVEHDVGNEILDES